MLSTVLVLAIGCLEPNEERPGFRLSGTLVGQPVEDWNFLTERYQLFLETRTWYGIRHSVTTACLVHDKEFYVPSPDPDSKRWIKNVADDPRVRVKVDDAVYALRAVRVEDEALRNKLLEKLIAKYEVYAGIHSKGVPIAFYLMNPKAES